MLCLNHCLHVLYTRAEPLLILQLDNPVQVCQLAHEPFSHLDEFFARIVGCAVSPVRDAPVAMGSLHKLQRATHVHASSHAAANLQDI